MRHLRMELDPKQRLFFVRNRRIWGIVRPPDRPEPGRERIELIAVRHPHVQRVAKTGEELVCECWRGAGGRRDDV
jgi:hypothetical protein